MTTLGFLRVIADAKVPCPEALVVLGGDGTFAASVSFPPLTTVAVNVERPGNLFAPALLAELGVEEKSSTIDLRDVIHLMPRSST